MKFHYAVFGITYFVGVICSIYFLGIWINKLFGFNIGQIAVIIVQGMAFYSMTKIQEHIKQQGVNEYKYQKEILK